MNTFQRITACCAAASLLGAAAWLMNNRPAVPELHQTRVDALLSPKSEVLENNAIPTSVTAAPMDRKFDRDRLLQEIATTQDQEVLMLVEAIYNAPTAEAKGIAADALASRGGFEAVANLLRIVGLHENPEDRAVILEGLKNLHHPEDFATLATTLAATQDMQVLDAVVQELSRSDSPAMIDVMVSLYRERNDAPFQKNQVLRALSSLRHPDLFRPLGKLAAWADEPALAEAARSARAQMRTAADQETESETES